MQLLRLFKCLTIILGFSCVFGKVYADPEMGVKANEGRLSIHYVGEYGGIPWDRPGTPIFAGLREDTQKYLYMAKVADAETLEWSPGEVGVRIRPGGSKPVIIWHINSPQAVQNISFQVDGRVNKTLNTECYLDISFDGKNWTNEKDSKGLRQNISGWAFLGLNIELAKLPYNKKVKEFYVRLRLIGGEFKKVHPYKSGIIENICIKARVSNEN